MKVNAIDWNLIWMCDSKKSTKKPNFDWLFRIACVDSLVKQTKFTVFVVMVMNHKCFYDQHTYLAPIHIRAHVLLKLFILSVVRFVRITEWNLLNASTYSKHWIVNRIFVSHCKTQTLKLQSITGYQFMCINVFMFIVHSCLSIIFPYLRQWHR